MAAGQVERGGVLVGMRVGMEGVGNARLGVKEGGVDAGVGGGDARNRHVRAYDAVTF